MDKLNDFIFLIEESLDSDVCNFLIETFENNSKKHERYDSNGVPNFTQFNLTKHRNYLNPKISQAHEYILKQVIEYKKKYYQVIGHQVFPNSNSYEEFRIKKYNIGGKDRFDTHVDVTNYQTAKRFLSFIWYLNDVEYGGETVFSNMIIKPKKGNLVIFPPLWLYPHSGNVPISGPKYIMSTYLHYQ